MAGPGRRCNMSRVDGAKPSFRREFRDGLHVGLWAGLGAGRRFGLGERPRRAGPASWFTVLGLRAKGTATPGGEGCAGVPGCWACALDAASSSSLSATNHANGSAYYERREAAVAQAQLLFRPQRWVARGGRETFWPTVSSHREGHARATEEVQAERLADVHNRVEKRFVSLVLLHLPGRELAHGQLIAPRQHLTP